jgi:hypothetical protein
VIGNTLATLLIALGFETSGLSSGGTKARSEISQIGTAADRASARVTSATNQMAAGIERTSKIAQAKSMAMGVGMGMVGFQVLNMGMNFVKGIFTATAAEDKLIKQTAAVIQSTKGAANVTEDFVRQQSTNLRDLTGVSDETVRSAQNMLLTFTAVKNGVKDGDDIFTQATQTTLDMAVALGTNAKSAAIMLGKALQDPILGMGNLKRVGVAFTAQQMDQVKALIKNNDLLGAQKMILKELNVEFGGSAVAFGQSAAGMQNKLKEAVEDIQQSIGHILIPLLVAVTPVFVGLFRGIGDAIQTVATILQPVIESIVGFIKSLPQPAVDLVGKVALVVAVLWALVAVGGPVIGMIIGLAAGFLAFGASLIPIALIVGGVVLAVGLLYTAVTALLNALNIDPGPGQKWKSFVEVIGDGVDELVGKLNVASAAAAATDPSAIPGVDAATLDSLDDLATKLGDLPDVGEITIPVEPVLTQQEQLKKKLTMLGQNLASSIAKGAKLAHPEVVTAAQLLTNAFFHTLAGVKGASKFLGSDAMGELAQGIIAARQKPVDAMKTLKEMMKHPLKTAEEETRLQGQLNSGALVKGLKSKDPAIRAQALATKGMILDRLNELKTGASGAAKAAGGALVEGLAAAISGAWVRGDIVVSISRTSAYLPSRKMGTITEGRFAGKEIPEYSVGSWRIPSDELAFLHKNEMVIPSGVAEQLRSGEGSLGGNGGGGESGPLIGTIVVNPGSDVSRGQARRFGQMVADEAGKALRDQTVRTVTPGGRRW